MIIAIEGTDGTGKTSVTRMLFNKYRGEGKNVILAGEPGHTEAGSKIRDILLGGVDMCPQCRLLLYLASMVDMVRDISCTYDNEVLHGDDLYIILDRFIFSTMAYQGDTTNMSTIEDLMYTFEIEDLWPDIIFILDMNPALALARKGRDNLDVIESQPIEYLEGVRARYLNIAETYMGTYIIDANRTIDKVFNEIVRIIGEYREAL